MKKLVLELARVSPPISSKLSRLNQAGRSLQWNKGENVAKRFSL